MDIQRNTNKLCSKCGIDKPRNEFHQRTKSKDGYASWCKQCKHNWKRNTDAGIKYKRKSKSKWSKNNREKANAHLIVCLAVKTGKLIREPCNVCGNNTDIHGHHENYDKPLDVIWLCRKCHRILHDKTKAR